MSMVSYEYVNM